MGFGVRNNNEKDELKFKNSLIRGVKYVSEYKKASQLKMDTPFRINYDDYLNKRYQLMDIAKWRTINEISEHIHSEYPSNYDKTPVRVPLGDLSTIHQKWLKSNPRYLQDLYMNYYINYYRELCILGL